MSRELIRDLDVANVVQGNAGKVSLDTEAFKKFLTGKKLPPTTIDIVIQGVQERMIRASSFTGDRIPQRVIDWCKWQMDLVMDGLVLASDALRGTSIRATADLTRNTDTNTNRGVNNSEVSNNNNNNGMPTLVGAIAALSNRPKVLAEQIDSRK